MKCTHRLYKWKRWIGAHKFERCSSGYSARFKKDGMLMYYVGVHRVCLGSYPPYIACFKHLNDLKTIRNGKWKNSFGDVKRYQFFYTLEKI